MESASLASLCSRISSGGTPRRSHPEYYSENGHLWVKSQELIDRPIDDTDERISDLGLANSSAKYYGEDTVLVAMYGATVGQLGILKTPATVNQAICALCVDPQRADHRYVFYALMATRRNLTIQAAGAAQQNLNQGLIRNFCIPIFPIDVQRSIAGVLGCLDDLIENNRRRIEVLEEMARLLYREWFVHFRFPGHEKVELIDSDLGPIPEGWDVARLAGLVSTQYGYTESANTDPVGPHYLRGMDINKSTFIDWSSVPFCPISEMDRQKFAVQVGDVFLIRMADPGKVGICERDVDAVFASYLVRLRPTEDRITPYYLFFTLSDEPYQGWVTGASTGSTRKSVSAKVMTEPSVVIPCTEVLKRFEDVVRPVRSLLNNLLEQNALLRQARDLLLPRLVSGELDVSELVLDLEAVGV